MKIYIAHNRQIDFINDLYKPIRDTNFADHEVVLPHEESDEPFNSREYLKTADLMIAEVSYPSTGIGIELGWADQYGCPIVAIHQDDCRASGSVRAVTDEVHAYSSKEELIQIIQSAIEKNAR